jgi:hypothetical protein
VAVAHSEGIQTRLVRLLAVRSLVDAQADSGDEVAAVEGEGLAACRTGHDWKDCEEGGGGGLLRCSGGIDACSNTKATDIASMHPTLWQGSSLLLLVLLPTPPRLILLRPLPAAAACPPPSLRAIIIKQQRAVDSCATLPRRQKVH